MLRSYLFGLAVTSFLLAQPVYAAKVINTAPIPSGIGGTLLLCQLVNVSSKPHEVTVEIVASGGSILATSGLVTINPASLVNASETTSFPNSFCRVSGISKKDGTVNLTIFNGSSVLMNVTAP